MTQYLHTSTSDIPAIVSLWNDAMGPQWPLTERLLQQTLYNDPHFEPEGCIGAYQGGQLVGWVLCKSMREPGPDLAKYKGKGGIGALVVHPDYRGHRIGSNLLDRAEGHIRAAGSHCSTLYFPHHLLPGVPAECEAALALFAKRGYVGFNSAYDLWRDLSDYAVPPKVLSALEQSPGVEIRPARESERPAVIAFVEREFPGGWTYTVRSHFAARCPASEIIIVVESGQVLGFCHTASFQSRRLTPPVYWHGLLGEHYGGLGPIGVAAAHRKRGLGLALVALAVQDLKERGVERMAIDWTVLLDFYGQLGFVPFKEYKQARQEVPWHG